MEPLATARQVLTWLWMYSDDGTSTKWQKIGHHACGQLCIIFQFLALVGCSIYAIKVASTDLGNCLIGFMFASGNFNACYNAIQMMWSRQKITELFKQLWGIYQNSKLL